MIATDLAEYFGRQHVFQLPVKAGRTADFYTRAQLLFDESANHDMLASRLEAGAEITGAAVSAGDEQDVSERLGAAGIPMFIHTPERHLRILDAGDRPKLEAGQELIGLIDRG